MPEVGAERTDPKTSGTAVTSKGRLGALGGAIFGVVVSLASNHYDWVFLYFFGGPWYVADILHDALGMPQWGVFPISSLYFGLIGWVIGTATSRRWLWRYRSGAVLAVILLHLFLAVTGDQRLFAELVRDLRPLPAPDMWPKATSTPSPAPSR